MFFMPPLATIFIIFCVCSNCVSRRLTSCTDTPAPVAMRRFRDALSNSGFARSSGRHGIDDPHQPADGALVDLAALRGAREIAGQLVEEALDAAHLFHLADLRLEIVEVEALAGFDLLRQGTRDLLVHLLVRVLDQGQDIAHAEDPRRHPVRMKNLEPGKLLAHADEFDRRAGDLPHRKRGAAARVAIELGEDDAGERQRRAECPRGIHRVLSLHRVDDEQRLHRRHLGVQRRDLLHHRLVDRETPRGIDYHHIVIVAARPIERRSRDRDRGFAGGGGKEIDADLRRQAS